MTDWFNYEALAMLTGQYSNSLIFGPRMITEGGEGRTPSEGLIYMSPFIGKIDTF